MLPKLALAGLVLAVPSVASAGPFDLSWAAFDPGDDVLAQVLRDLFLTNSNAEGIGNQRTIIGILMGLFSAAVGIIAMTTIIYQTLVATFSAGEKGVVLDEKTSWLAAVRIPLAAIMMYPHSDVGTSTGAQLVVQTGLASIGITRTLYAAAVKGIGPDAVPIATPMIPGTKTIVAGLMHNELCRALINLATNNPEMVPVPTQSTGGFRPMGGYVSWSYSLAPGNETSAPVCGTVTVRQPAETAGVNIMGVSVDMSDQQRQILTNVLKNQIRPQIEQVAANFWRSRQAASLAPMQSVLITATNAYTQQLTSTATEIVSKLRGAVSADSARTGAIGVQGNMDRLSALGWWSAGSYALEMMRLNGSTLSLLSALPSVTPPTYAGLGPNLSADLAPFVHAALIWRDRLNNYVQTVDGLDVPGGNSDLFVGATPGDDGATTLERVVRSLRINERVLNAFITVTAPAAQLWQDPFAAQIQLGHRLILISLSALGMASILASTTGAAGTMAVNVLTFNFSGAAATAAGYLTMQFLATPIFYGLMALLIPGLILAFLLPLMPYFFWYAGVLGWLILVIEAVIAVPLWMYAHLTYRGEGLHGRGIEGYALIFNVLLRPSLMLMGLFLGYVIYGVGSWMLARSFGVVASFALSNGWFVGNMLGVVLLMCVFVVMHIVTTTQAFRLISLAPHHIVKLAGIAPANRVDMDSVAQQMGLAGMATSLEAIKTSVATMAQSAARDGGDASSPALPAPEGTSKGPFALDRTVAASSDIVPPPSSPPAKES